MKILVVHNRYSTRTPSGENAVVDNEIRWLQDAGVEVARYEVSNDEVFEAGIGAKLRTSLLAPWSPPAAREARRLLDRHRPDVVHVHNLFPLLTGSVAGTAVKSDVPVLWTVHNHRIGCVAGTHFRSGEICERCRPGWRLPGVALGCYQSSAVASATVTAGTSLFARIARRRLTTLAVSDYLRDWLLARGFDPQRTITKFNGVASPGSIADATRPSASRVVLFLGRLVEHKGVRLLLESWRRVDHVDAELRVVGSGPLEDVVRDEATRDPRIQVVGQVDKEEVTRHLLESRVLVVPSIWREPFPLVALDGLAHGRPVVTTGFGGLADSVDESCGWITGTAPEVVAQAIDTTLRSDDVVDVKGAAGRARYEARFAPGATTARLVELYEQAIDGVARDS